jgi:hypothetical protein
MEYNKQMVSGVTLNCNCNWAGIFRGCRKGDEEDETDDSSSSVSPERHHDYRRGATDSSGRGRRLHRSHRRYDHSPPSSPTDPTRAAILDRDNYIGVIGPRGELIYVPPERVDARGRVVQFLSPSSPVRRTHSSVEREYRRRETRSALQTYEAVVSRVLREKGYTDYAEQGLAYLAGKCGLRKPKHCLTKAMVDTIAKRVLALTGVDPRQLTSDTHEGLRRFSEFKVMDTIEYLGPLPPEAVQHLADGTVRVHREGGLIRDILPDGTIRTTFPNGDLEIEVPDGFKHFIKKEQPTTLPPMASEQWAVALPPPARTEVQESTV